MFDVRKRHGKGARFEVEKVRDGRFIKKNN